MLLSAEHIVAELPGERGPVRVLDGAGLDVGRGEVLDVVGPSGSGKSTLLRALALLLPGANAELALEGRTAAEYTPQHWRARVALVPQKPAIVAGTVRDNLELPWQLKLHHREGAPDEQALLSALESVGLGAVGLDRDAARLSVGQHARLALLRVLLTAPAVLLLDEPDAALDDASSERVSALTADFATRGGGVVRVRHRGADGIATRRLELADGVLREVGR